MLLKLHIKLFLRYYWSCLKNSFTEQKIIPEQFLLLQWDVSYISRLWPLEILWLFISLQKVLTYCKRMTIWEAINFLSDELRLLDYVRIFFISFCSILTILRYLSCIINVLDGFLRIDLCLVIKIKIRNTILFLKVLLRSLFELLIFGMSSWKISSVVFSWFDFFKTTEMMLIWTVIEPLLMFLHFFWSIKIEDENKLIRIIEYFINFILCDFIIFNYIIYQSFISLIFY